MKLETLQKGFYYHIYNRGINGENIFYNDSNKEYFLKLYKKYLTDKVSTFAFCLLSNHFHLIVRIESSPKDCTQAFSNFFNAYAKSLNKSCDRTGSLFEKHFKRIELTSETYLKRLILYIHLNPKFHFEKDYEKFKYSSYFSILSEKTTLLKRREVLELFGDKNNFITCHRGVMNDFDEEYTLE